MEDISDMRNAVSRNFKSGKTFWLFIIALIGLGLSIKLSIIYYMVNFVPDAPPSFCVINDTIDCDAVAGTIFSQFLGIPLALFGVFLYSFIIFLCFVDKLQNIKWLGFLKVFKNKFAYIYTLYLISFSISMLLTFVQFVLIKKFCILCFITYLVDFVSLFIAKDWGQSLFYEIKTSIIDFLEALRIKKYLIAFIVILLFGSSALAYAKISYIFTPQVKRYDSFNYFQKLKGNPFDAHGNVLGNPDGEVIVYEYSDFECPWCKIMNRMIQKAVTEYDNIYVVHYNFPLDIQCNRALKRQIHNNACKYAGFAIASKKQDKYWDMINLFFDKQPRKNPEVSNQEIYKWAEEIGVDSTQLANDYIKPEISDELTTEIIEGLKKGIDATPTIFINGQKYSDDFTYEKLTEALVKAGATPKKNKEK